MAGSNQSVNLSGMLNNIAGTIGEGYTINGKNAGEAMGDNVREAFRPQGEMNDPEHVKAMAQWAQRNGKEKEALAYAEKAAEVQAAQATTGMLDQVRGIRERMAAPDINLGEYDRLNSQLQALPATTFETANFLDRQTRETSAGREAVVDRGNASTAQTVVQYQDLLEDPNANLTPEARDGMNQWVQTQLQNQPVAEAVNKIGETKHKMVEREVEARDLASTEATNGFAGLYETGGIAAVAAEAQKQGTEQAMAALATYQKHDDLLTKLKEATPEERRAEEASILTDLESSLEFLTAELGVDGTKTMNDQLARLKVQTQPGNTLYGDQTGRDIRSLMNQIRTQEVALTNEKIKTHNKGVGEMLEAETRIRRMPVTRVQANAIRSNLLNSLEEAHSNKSWFFQMFPADTDLPPALEVEDMVRDYSRSREKLPTTKYKMENERFVMDKDGRPVLLTPAEQEANRLEFASYTEQNAASPATPAPLSKLTPSQQANVDNMIATAKKIGKNLTEAEARQKLNL